MRTRLISSLFIIIGTAIGIILSLQIRAQPIKLGSFPLEQLETQKQLLTTFSTEQDELKRRLDAVESKLKDAQEIIAQRSSKATLRQLEDLRNKTAFNSITGQGIKITLKDNASVNRLDFSTVKEAFVQATDVRDLTNALFLKGAKAIAVNGKRIGPLTPIQSVFDSILVGNIQINSPFVVEAIGTLDELIDGVNTIRSRKIQIHIDSPIYLKLDPIDATRTIKFMTLES